ncbi:MAG: methyl-accepting chemotaxis protein, partial [Pseudomonadota bacterium]
MSKDLKPADMRIFRKLKLWQKLGFAMLSMGILPMMIVTISASTSASQSIKEQAFSKLEAVRQIKSNAVLKHFEDSQSVINTIASQPDVIRAANELKSSFNRYAMELGFSPEQIEVMRDELSSYYYDEFAAEYKERNGKKVDVTRLVSDLSPIAVALQHAYILENPNPLGEKDAMYNVPNSSTYNRHHNQHHGMFRQILQEFGYYDIFLVDPESGHIYYSVFKELDYATSLITGSYADTNFAQAFNKTATTNQGVTVDFNQYYPSYHAPASFQSVPVMDGERTAAILVF